MDPARFDVGRVETPAGQWTEQSLLDGEAFGRFGPRRAVDSLMDPSAHPVRRPFVKFANRGRWSQCGALF